MKKLLFLLLASFLVLAACGQEESKLEDKKETKASDKESKEDDKKSDDDKQKSKDKEDKSNEEVANEESQSQEQQSTEEPVQSQEQVNTQEQPIQSQEQAPAVEEQPVQQEPIDEERWARENIEGGTDAHAADEMEAFYQQERAKELEKEQKADAINEKMEDPSLSKDEYNELVYEFNDLHDE